jgi:predicted Rossmann fold flavoprotein
MAAEWDLVVVGAGAAGLLGGSRAAERGLRVLVLEKNAKPGVKILMSGGTRCNVTQDTDARGIVAAFGPAGRFLHSALAALGPRDLIDLLKAEGVPTKVEPSGKVFPVSDRAVDVQQALLRRLERRGATLVRRAPVQDWERTELGWRLFTPQGSIETPRVLLTTGGQSYPGCGTTGDGYRLAAKVGHTIVPPRPALVPLTTPTPWVPDLAGVALGDVAVQVVPAADRRRPLASARGSFLFTHTGFSGPVVLNVSRAVTAASDPSDRLLCVDWLPAVPEPTLEAAFVRAAQEHGKRLVVSWLSDRLPRRLAEVLLSEAQIPLERRLSGLSRAERRKLLARLKQHLLPVSGSLGFAKAEVTAGGISLAEVDPRTMQSLKAPGLYLAGEVLDLDGPIGGYNFQAAFSTGWLAAERMPVPGR